VTLGGEREDELPPEKRKQKNKWPQTKKNTSRTSAQEEDRGPEISEQTMEVPNLLLMGTPIRERVIGDSERINGNKKGGKVQENRKSKEKS